jgi:predicted transcriptional regulator
VKKNQIELMNVLKSVDQWLTASEIAERLNAHPNKVHRIIASENFKDVAKGILDTGKATGGRYVTVYKLMDKQKSNVDYALALAKKHKGIWGQLSWSNQMKVELI